MKELETRMSNIAAANNQFGLNKNWKSPKLTRDQINRLGRNQKPSQGQRSEASKCRIQGLTSEWDSKFPGPFEASWLTLLNKEGVCDEREAAARLC